MLLTMSTSNLRNCRCFIFISGSYPGLNSHLKIGSYCRQPQKGHCLFVIQVQLFQGCQQPFSEGYVGNTRRYVPLIAKDRKATTTINTVGIIQNRQGPDPSPLVGSDAACNIPGPNPSSMRKSNQRAEIRNGFLVTTPRSPITKKKSAIVPKEPGYRRVMTKRFFIPNNVDTGSWVSAVCGRSKATTSLCCLKAAILNAVKPDASRILGSAPLASSSCATFLVAFRCSYHQSRHSVVAFGADVCAFVDQKFDDLCSTRVPQISVGSGRPALRCGSAPAASNCPT